MNFLEHANKSDSKVKFILELEANKSLRFLDVYLNRNKLTHCVDRTGYMKSCPYSSHSPFHYKAVEQGFYIKLEFEVCSDIHQQYELNKSKLIANSNGFFSGFIDKLIYKFKYTEKAEIEGISKKDLSYMMAN